MKLTFPAWNAGKYISLAYILSILEFSCITLTWRLSVGEAAPEPGADALYAIDSTMPMSYSDLLSLATHNLQIIDGELVGNRGSPDSTCQLRIRAVDSTSWDIETDMDDVINGILKAFPNAREFD